MQYDYVAPPKPSLKRWRSITSRFQGLSLLRMMEYERLSTLALPGRVLDVGGGRQATYLGVLPGAPTIESVNIDPKIDPTHLIEPGAELPFEEDTFDAIICFNTLEHIYDPRAMLDQMFRVLAPGGTLYVIVPFMFRIHGHPDDFTRATPSWWRETMSRVGFTRLMLEPIVWGRASTGAVVPGMHGAFPRLRLHLAMLRDVLYSRLFFRGQRLDGRRGERIASTSPGWFMAAIKETK